MNYASKVSLWRTQDGRKLAGVMIPQGTAAPLVGEFRYQSTTPKLYHQRYRAG